MDNDKVVENNQDSCTTDLAVENCTPKITLPETVEVNKDLLEAIKNFMDDLSNITEAKDFMDYHIIVNHIDDTKVKSYTKLVKGFVNFFNNNINALSEGNFNDLVDPYISFVSDNGSINFNFQEMFQSAEEDDQDIIKDHLNHIWNLFNNSNKGPEELYIDKIFKELQSEFSPNLTREDQMSLAKNLFNDFQKQNLDVSIVVKVACRKARQLLLNNGSDDHSKTLILICAVEDIDINNFNMIQFMNLIGKVGTLFADGETNPLSGLLSTILSNNNLPSIEELKLDDDK